MKIPITNIMKICQWGRTYHYFDIRNPHQWEGLSFAMGRKWRVVKTIDHGKHTTYRCVPIEEKRREPEVKMLCGVRFVKDKDGEWIAH